MVSSIARSCSDLIAAAAVRRAWAVAGVAMSEVDMTSSLSVESTTISDEFSSLETLQSERS